MASLEFSETIPVSPNMINKKMNPTVNNMGVWYCIEPPFHFKVKNKCNPTKDFHSSGENYDHGSCGKAWVSMSKPIVNI